MNCLDLLFYKEVPFPDLSLLDLSSTKEDLINETLLVSEDVIHFEMYDVIGAAIAGYLINKKITVQGVLYGSNLHNTLNNFMMD